MGAVYGYLNVGESSVTLNVTPGVAYRCFAPTRRGYKKSVLPTTTVTSGSAQTLIVTYTALNQNVSVNLIDSNGALFSAPAASLSCGDAFNGSTSESFAPNSSTHIMPVDVGEVSCSVSGIDGYATTPQSIPVLMETGVDQTVTFTVRELAATLTVTFLDGSGNPVVGSVSGAPSVNCVSEFAGERVEFSGTTLNGQSSLTMNVLGGITYDCSVPSVFAFQNGEFAVAVGNSESKAVNFAMVEKTAPLKIKVTDASGSPVSVPVGQGTAPVSCESSSGSAQSASGEIPEGASEVTILTAPGRYNCSIENFPGYKIRYIPKTALTKNGVTAEYSFVADVTESSVTINFLDDFGAALPVPTNPDSSWPSVECKGAKGRFFKSLTPGDTFTVVNVIGGAAYRCLVTGFYGYLDAATSVTLQPGEAKTISVTKPTLSSEITVSVVDQSGNLFVSSQNIEINFFSPAQGGLYFNASIPSGSYSTGVVKALGGLTYEVRAYVGDGEPLSVGSVTAPSSGAASVQIQKLQRDATLTLRLVDSNGTVVSGLKNLQAGFGTYSNIDHFASASFFNGVARTNLRGGNTYTVWYNAVGNPRIYNLLSTGSDKYFFPLQKSSFTVESGQSVTRDLVVYRANATLTVNSAVGQGWVGIYPKSIATDSFIGGDFQGGQTSLAIPIPAGTHYVVYDPGVGAVAERREITVTEGGNVTLSFAPPVSDLNLAVLATFPGVTGGVLQCNAYNGDFSVYNFEGEMGGGASYLPITSTHREWTIACKGWNEITGKIYGGKATYTVPDPLPALGLDSLTVAIAEKGEIFSAASTGSSDSDIVVPVQGSSSLFSPVGTFDKNKVVTVEITNKASAPETKDIEPSKVLKISAKDSNQNTLEAAGTVALQLTLGPSQEAFTYTKRTGYVRFNKTSGAQVKGVGIAAADQYTIQIPKDVFNAEEGVVVVTGDEVSPTPNPGAPSQVPGKPRNLALSRKKVGRFQSIVATWDQSTGDISSYSITLVHKGRVVKTVRVSANQKLKATFSGLRPGVFRVQMRASNAQGRSAMAVEQIKLR